VLSRLPSRRDAQGDAELVAADFFLLRTPLLPFDAWEQWSRAGSDTDSLEEQAAHLRRELASLLATDPTLREAIDIAAPSLLDGLHRWRRDPLGRKGRAVERTLVSFLARMTTRPTPFGLFAGITRGGVGETTALRLPPRREYARLTRVDLRYLYDLSGALLAEDGVRSRVRYRPASSVHVAGGTVRYLEPRRSQLIPDLRHYSSVACSAEPHLLAALARAAEGATRAELVAALLLQEGDESLRPEVESFADELIDCGLLAAELEPALTTSDPLAAMIDDLDALGEAGGQVESLRRFRGRLAALDRAGLGLDPQAYRDAARPLEDAAVPVDPTRLFHVDLFKPGVVEIGHEVLDEVARGIRVLHRVYPSDAEIPLAAFKRSFVERYGAREMPLLEALDEETGIGLGRASTLVLPDLVQGLQLPGSEAPPQMSWRKQDESLLRRVVAATAAGASEIELDEEALRALETPSPGPLLTAFSVNVTFVASSLSAFQQGRYCYFLDGYSSAAALLGRYCNWDAELHADVRRWLQEEEALEPGAVYAEVVHHPVGQNVGNVVCRPVLRAYEIPFLGRSGAPPDRQIPVSDLRVSVQNGRLVLRSARLDREVRPRMSTAHAFLNEGNVAVYRFLCSLHAQSIWNPLLWRWSPVFESLPFLPRLCAGRLILSPARWRIEADALTALEAAVGRGSFAAVRAWREERRLPRFVHLLEGRRRLMFDFDNALSLAGLLAQVRGRHAVVLTEMLPSPEGLCVEGPEGRFCHDAVVPFLCKGPSSSTSAEPTAVPRVLAAVTSTRAFAPGSEWLYAKLYSGTVMADRVLLELAASLIEPLAAQRAIDGWFFIRYEDPHPHLRLRLHGDRDAIQKIAVPALHEAVAPLVADGALWRFELASYERELERYGGEAGIELCERIFHADSLAVLGLLRRSNQDDRARSARWRLGLAGVEALLADFEPELPRRLVLARRLRDSFHREFRIGQKQRHRLGEKFRRERASIEEALARSANPWCRAVLEQRSGRIAEPVARLRELAAAGRLAASVEEIVASLVHLHVNRLLRSAQRLQEVVLYDFLARGHESRLARRAGQSQGVSTC
jgi:thiopeptide-type bacteriocin biosynthesis protein